MSATDWYPGLAAVLAVVGSFLVTGALIRRLVLREWSGPPALLADLVLGVSVMVVVAQLLGLVGLLTVPGLLLAAGLVLVAFLLVWQLRGRPGSGEGPEEAARPRLTIPIAIALGGLLLVGFEWITQTLDSLEAGMYGGDTLWYHMPFAAHFAQTGSTTGLTFVDTQYLHWFYPQNSELIHAIPLVLAGSDLFSPVVNYFWLALGVLAGWCIGRPYRMALPAALAVVLVMAMEVISSRQPGSANNDAMVVALLLAAVAIAVTAWRAGEQDGPTGRFRPGAGPALLVACLALGLAIGTKLTAIGPGVILLVGFILLLERGSRLRWGSAMVLATALTGAFWYFRNLAYTANPLPWLSFGPLEKAGELTGREPRPIVEYLTDPTIWSEWIAPGLSDRLGPFWLTFLIAVLVGLGLGLFSRDRLRILIAVSGIAALVAYVLIPLGAAGPEGAPTAFGVNVRYVTPALALGFVSLALPPARIDGRTWTIAISWLFLIGIGVSFVQSGGLDLDGYPPGAMLAAFLVLAVLPATIALAWTTRHRGPALALAIVWLVGVAALGSYQEDRYSDYRYSSTSPRYPEMEYPALELAQGIGPANDLIRDLKGRRIGLSGSLAQYYQYGFWGPGASNEVEAIGLETGRSDLEPPASCREWVAALEEGSYDLVITSPPVPDRDPGTETTAVEEGWIDSASADLVLERERLAVWKPDERPTGAATCGKR